ncbi:hypothetical protein HK096_010037 [Nowakowskiella sp. JEL0078]|nr:hypothetical protein HK096_010037 [Nowakowskiella sp. JEL0078]
MSLNKNIPPINSDIYDSIPDIQTGSLSYRNRIHQELMNMNISSDRHNHPDPEQQNFIITPDLPQNVRPSVVPMENQEYLFNPFTEISTQPWLPSRAHQIDPHFQNIPQNPLNWNTIQNSFQPNVRRKSDDFYRLSPAVLQIPLNSNLSHFDLSQNPIPDLISSEPSSVTPFHSQTYSRLIQQNLNKNNPFIKSDKYDMQKKGNQSIQKEHSTEDDVIQMQTSRSKVVQRSGSITASSESEGGNMPTTIRDRRTLKRLKNTEAARRSRARKIEKMETLEREIKLLETKNQSLLVRIAVLESEKQQWKKEQSTYEKRISELESQLTETRQTVFSKFGEAVKASDGEILTCVDMLECDQNLDSTNQENH